MPTLTTTQTATTEVTIAPALLKKLRLQVAVYQKLAAEKKSIEAKMDAAKNAIEEVREQTDEISVNVDGTTITRVAPVRSVLNKTRLFALGCAPAWLNEAMELKPSKPYTKITLAHDDEDDE